MIRVLHLVLSLEPGGMENGVVNTANRLDPARFDPGVLCLRRRGAFADRLDPRVRCDVLGLPERFSPTGVARLAARLRAFRPDVLHTHNLGPLLYAVPAVALSGRRLAIVHGEHSALAAEDLRPKRLLQRRILYCFARSIHTVSAGLAADLSSRGLRHPRMRAVLNGVDASRFRPDPESRRSVRRELGIPADALVCGMVARFGLHKRHDLLLEGFERAAVGDSGLWLILVGAGGPLEQTVADLARRSSVADHIRLAGFQPEPARFYAALDLLVMPSVNEGLSNALLEAMACGVPVLTHPACGAAEVVTDGVEGRVVALDSSGAMAEALSGLRANLEEWAARGRRARETAIRRFSMETMVRGHESLYAEAVRRA